MICTRVDDDPRIGPDSALDARCLSSCITEIFSTDRINKLLECPEMIAGPKTRKRERGEGEEEVVVVVCRGMTWMLRVD